MTPEERQMLTALTDRIKAAPAQQRDFEADQMIRDLTLARPDAPYLLAQTVLMQDFALRNAQAQIADLQRQLQAAQQPRGSGSFLGNLFGSSPSAPSVPTAGPWGQAPQPTYAPPPTGYGYQPVVMQPTQTSGFLRQAATTAAGIAGGALLFEGIESLFAGHPGYGGFGAPMGPWGGGEFMPRESISETIVNNNYYEQPGGSGELRSADYVPDQSDAGLQDVADTGDFGSTDFGGDDYA
jgi:hypothetical protein